MNLARHIERANRVLRDRLINAHVIIDPDGAASLCDGVYLASEKDLVQTTEGEVTVNNVGPTLCVLLSDLPSPPLTDQILTVAVQQGNGTFAPPIRYRVTNTGDDGYGWTKMNLVNAPAVA